jgi:transposase-like protein
MSVSGEGAVMTTLNDMTAKKKSEPCAEEIAARELVRVAKEQGLSLTGPDGLGKQFTKSVLETALNEEMTEHLGHEKNRAPGARDSANVRNGTRPKTVLTHASGQVELEVPRDREGTFEPVIVRKRQRRLTEVDEIVLSLYARGLTTGEIAAHFDQIYGASVSKETISRITDKVIEEMQAWSTRPLQEVYAAIFIDAIVVKVRDGQVANRPIYAAIGVSLAGEKDVLGLWAGTGGEGAKFWMSVLSDLRNRGVKDTFFVVCDGLKGLPEVVGHVWALSTVQTCIIHLIRNTFRLAEGLGRAQTRRETDLHRGQRRGRPVSVGGADREVGPQVRCDHPALEQRLGGVHPLPGLRRRDPHRTVLDQRHRVTERPLPPGGQGPRPLPDRASRHEMSLPGHQIPGPHRARQATMDHALEASAQRVRHHLRRPLAGSRNLLMKTAGNTVNPVFDSGGPAGSLHLLSAVGGHCL